MLRARQGHEVQPGRCAFIAKRIAALPTVGGRTDWMLAFALCALLMLLFLYLVTLAFAAGGSLLGLTIPVVWRIAIANVVAWLGIGHAGALVAAIRLLLQQPWRIADKRFAEAITLFAAGGAALLPFIYLERPQFFYWLAPYPSPLGLWSQWRSPLVWAFSTIAAYIAVSLLFWYLGLLPELARRRDHSRQSWRVRFYALFALGWHGAASHWQRYQTAYLIIAGLIISLVLLLHSVVAMNFAVTLIPEYHAQLFPIYFIAGTICSGAATALMLAIPLRRVFKLEELITLRHLDALSQALLATGLVIGYCHLMEHFIIWYSGAVDERYKAVQRLFGPYAEVWRLMLMINVLGVQLLWFKALRRRPWLLFAVAAVLSISLWLERYVLVLSCGYWDFLPSAWTAHSGNRVNWIMLPGGLGLFAMLFLLFIRRTPGARCEEKVLLHRQRRKEEI